MNRKAIFEALKEALRIAVFGAVGALIAWLTSLDQTTTVVVSLFVLRTIDKYLHKSDVDVNGLLPF